MLILKLNTNYLKDYQLIYKIHFLTNFVKKNCQLFLALKSFSLAVSQLSTLVQNVTKKRTAQQKLTSARSNSL